MIVNEGKIMPVSAWQVIAGCALVAVTGSASAAVLITPGVHTGPGGEVECTITNLSAQTRDGTIEFMASNGQPFVTVPRHLPGGGVGNVISFHPNTLIYCRITLPDVTKTNM